MVEDIGFGVVGLGMGRHHCMAINAAPGGRLAAVCDVDAARRQKAVEEYGCKGYADFAEMLQDPEVRVVNIATPSGTHVELGLEAVAAGKHLIVEKPADISTDRIDALVAAGRKRQVKVAGIFQSRFDPLNIRIREAIEAGRLGKLIGVHGHLPWYRKQSYYEGEHGTWKGTWAMDGGGSLMNQGVHTVDLLQWFAGPVTEVAGMHGIFDHKIEAEDQSVAILRFANGALGTLFTTTCCYPGYNQQITIYGSGGSIVKEEGRLKSWKMLEDEGGAEEKEMLALYGSDAERSGAADPLAVSFDGHTQIVLDLMEAVRNDREPTITLESARHAVEIINAVYEAGRDGRQIQLGG